MCDQVYGERVQTGGLVSIKTAKELLLSQEQSVYLFCARLMCLNGFKFLTVPKIFKFPILY